MKNLIYGIIYNSKINYLLRISNKMLDKFLSNKIRIPPSGTMSIALENNRKLKLKTNQSNHLTYLIFWNGYENFEYTKIFVDLIKRIKVFIDIGANIGYYSLLASIENENLQVVGFEPASGALYYFKENVKLNSLTNVKVESMALSNVCGESVFFEVENKKYPLLSHNLSGESNLEGHQKRLNFIENLVQTITLDKYIADNDINNIDLIKMDTEGTENLILMKSDRVLREMKPIIICETLFNTIEDQLEKIMRNYGYEFYNHVGESLVKVDGINRSIDDGVKNCFFVHPERFTLIEDYVE